MELCCGRNLRVLSLLSGLQSPALMGHGQSLQAHPPRVLYVPAILEYFSVLQKCQTFPYFRAFNTYCCCFIWNILLSLFPQSMSFFQISDLTSKFSLDVVARLGACISCVNGPAHHCKYFICHFLSRVCLCHSTVSLQGEVLYLSCLQVYLCAQH